MRRTIPRDFRILSSLTILLSALLIGGSWAVIDYNELVQQSSEMRTRLLEEQKGELTERVQRAVDFISFYQTRTETRLKQTIKARTYEACNIAAALVNKYRGDLPPNKLHQRIRDSLRHIRYNNGRGYFFAINVNGIEELFADKPHLEGKDLTAMQDSNGQFVVKDMLKLAADEGEGFYSYTWTKPGNDRNDNVKIAFVKHLPELDWVIGTGEYLEDVERDLQQEVLMSLDAVYRDPAGVNYLFVGTWEGLALSGPAKGRNMLEIQDSNGLFIVKELINKSRGGGGFVEYVIPKLEGQRGAPKLSYVSGIPEWRWYIGTGEYIDNIEEALTGLKSNFYAQLKKHSLHILFFTIGVLLLNLFIGNRFAHKLRSQTKRFVDFFHQAAESPAGIDTSTLLHSEFRSIGAAANNMLDERNSALSELQASEERFRQIFETIPDPVIIARTDNQEIIDVNNAFEKWSGTPRTVAVGKHSLELDFWANPEDKKSFLQRLEAGGSLNNFEAELIVRGTLTRTALLSSRLLKIGDEHLRLTVIRDISTEKQAERSLIEMDRMKSEFISTAAHELSTPLSAMMGYTELLLTPEEFGGFTMDQQKDFLNEIYDRGEALNQIINDLLDISRIERGLPVTLDLQNIDLAEVLEKTISHFRTRNPGHRYQLTLPEACAAPILADRHRIRQVFENLLSNATKYTPSGKTIAIEGNELHGGWEVIIEDEGIGMKPEQLERVFDKFFRADASNTAVGGLGLGMSIARQIVEAHGGEIKIESRVDQGTRASIFLPRKSP